MKFDDFLKYISRNEIWFWNDTKILGRTENISKINFKWPLGDLGGQNWPQITKITTSWDIFAKKIDFFLEIKIIYWYFSIH